MSDEATISPEAMDRALAAAHDALGGSMGDSKRLIAVLEAVAPIIWNDATAQGQEKINQECYFWMVEHVGEARRLDELIAERAAGAAEVGRGMIKWIDEHSDQSLPIMVPFELVRQQVLALTLGLDLGIDSPDPPGENG